MKSIHRQMFREVRSTFAPGFIAGFCLLLLMLCAHFAVSLAWVIL